MTLYQQTTGLRQICAAATGGVLAKVKVVAYSQIDWGIQLVDAAGDAVDMTGLTGAVVIKPQSDFEGAALALWDLTEVDGAVVLDVDSADSADLRDALDGKLSINAWLQILWTPAGGVEQRSLPLQITILNSPAQPDEVGMEPGTARLYEAIKAMLIQGSNQTITPDDVARTLTLAGAAAYSGPSLRLTGQILEVSVAGAWRQIATLPAGSLG